MKENKKIMQSVFINKMFYIPVVLTAICAYGFYITHYFIGVDDTSLARYYIDGYALSVGRYTIFLLGKIIELTSFAPFILEFINVILLIFAALIWVTLIKRIVGDKIPIILYTLFACLFISFPLFNEIFVYYLHGSPGMSLGYSLIAFAALSVNTYLEGKQWKKIGSLLGASLCIYVTLGIYESFVLVYIMACATIFFLYTLFSEEHFSVKRFFLWIGVFLGPLILGMLLRSLTFWIILSISDIPNFMRGASDLKWLFMEGRGDRLDRIYSDFIAKYVINGLFYLPIRNYLLASVGLFFYTIVKIIRRKNGWIAVGALGILVSPWLITPFEGEIIAYRANLGLAFACSLSILLISYEIYKHFKYKWIVILIGFIIVYNQSFDLNHWFYLQQVKYQYQVELTNQIYYKLAANYDLTKKVMFIGDTNLPETLQQETHISRDDKNYPVIEKIANKLNIKLSEKLFDSYGYIYTEVPNMYLYSWGQDAFEEGCVEIAKFYAMLGYTIVPGTLGDWYEAEFLCQDAPCFPKEGSIIEFNNYIVVKLADYTY